MQAITKEKAFNSLNSFKTNAIQKRLTRLLKSVIRELGYRKNPPMDFKIAKSLSFCSEFVDRFSVHVILMGF
ncbi:hypothetical protein DDP44_05560 [Helicobacter pylori]|nr:hypothetical protein DDP44_05560 [Helicobacter pylori]